VQEGEHVEPTRQKSNQKELYYPSHPESGLLIIKVIMVISIHGGKCHDYPMVSHQHRLQKRHHQARANELEYEEFTTRLSWITEVEHLLGPCWALLGPCWKVCVFIAQWK
jgi:hypothetical protein